MDHDNSMKMKLCKYSTIVKAYNESQNFKHDPT